MKHNFLKAYFKAYGQNEKVYRPLLHTTTLLLAVISIYLKLSSLLPLAYTIAPAILKERRTANAL